jgi:hypothetical protein
MEPKLRPLDHVASTDWEKVPKGTEVQVTNDPQYGWTAFPRQYIGYVEALDRPHVVYCVGFCGHSQGIEQWAHCRLACTPDPSWLRGAG